MVVTYLHIFEQILNTSLLPGYISNWVTFHLNMQDICEKRLQIQLLSYLCSVKAEFGKIYTVSFPIVFVTVFRIPLYEE